MRTWMLVLGLCGSLGCAGDSSRAADGDTADSAIDSVEETHDIGDSEGDSVEEIQDVGDSAIDSVEETQDLGDSTIDSIEETQDLGDSTIDSVEETQDLGDSTIDSVEVTQDGGDVGDTTPDPYAGLEGDALRSVLEAETRLGHTPLGYNGGRDAMYAVGGIDDVGGRIECIYTGRTVDTTGSRTPNRNCRLSDGTATTCSFNTEHTWARYYLREALTENSPAYDAAEGDIHHLRPSDDDVNNARWHFDFGETNCPSDGACKLTEESVLGQRPGLSGYTNCPTGNLTLSHVCVMEVRPLRRGDIARGMFYMAIRYRMDMHDAMEAALRVWNEQDPPDALERARNDGVESAQGNRNPFIDRPDLVSRIQDF